MSERKIPSSTFFVCDRCGNDQEDTPNDWRAYGHKIEGQTAGQAMDGAMAGGPRIGPMDLCGSCLKSWRNWLSNPEPVFLDVVFDGPPSHEAGRFVEVETPDGESVGSNLHGVSEWIEPPEGGENWRLRFRVAP